MTAFLPWQATQWAHLQRRVDQQRLPHALLLTGPRGIGKEAFAFYLAQALLCEQPGPNGHPCGICRPCHWFAAGTHPDFFVLKPEDAEKQIKIDPLRELCEALSLTAQSGHYRIALITPAQRMNTAAANSLLKTLEEPGAQTLLLLASEQPSALPATLRSRCQRIHFAPTQGALATEWLRSQVGSNQDPELLLALAGGGPLAAVELFQSGCVPQRAGMLEDLIRVRRGEEDPVALAGRWISLGLPLCIHWMTTWVMDMLRLKTAPHSPAVINRDLGEPLQHFAEIIDFSRLFKYLDGLLDASRVLNTTVNAQLLLESLLIDWSEPEGYYDR